MPPEPGADGREGDGPEAPRTSQGVVVPGVFNGLKVVGLGCGLVVVVLLGIAFLLRNSFAELGNQTQANLAEVVSVSAEHPFAVRILAATVDPGDVELESIPLGLYVSTNVPPSEMWVSAIRIEDGRAIELASRSEASFEDAFPAACLTETCSATYALMVCWLLPPASGDTGLYFGGGLYARAANRVIPDATVTLDPVEGQLDPAVIAFARLNGCEAAS